MACAEILSIGTELLLGQILDTNSQFISQELADLGVDCLFRTTVGDNSRRIMDTFRHALDRSEIVISTGGLGPTADDLTHECIAELLGVQMVFDESVLAHIEGLFQKMGRPMVDSNRKQALRPYGAEILANPTGTAPGIIWKLSAAELARAGVNEPQRQRYILTFPGVPSEMKRMWRESARPFISQEFGPSVVYSVEMKHYGIGESSLAEKYRDLLDGQNPTVAPLAGSGECRLRVSAKAKSIEEAKKIVMPTVEKIKNESGHLCYGVDAENLETVVAEMLKLRGLSVAAAESCSGGLLSKRLTDIPGSSAYVKLNLVTYANEAKQNLLHVSEGILQKYGAVSPECAIAMAEGARKLAGTEIGISITGIAGPEGGTAEKPVGLVFLGLSTRDYTGSFRRTFPEQMGREGIRFRSASEALNLLRLYLLNPDLLDSL